MIPKQKVEKKERNLPKEPLGTERNEPVAPPRLPSLVPASINDMPVFDDVRLGGLGEDPVDEGLRGAMG